MGRTLEFGNDTDALVWLAQSYFYLSMGPTGERLPLVPIPVNPEALDAIAEATKLFKEYVRTEAENGRRRLVATVSAPITLTLEPSAYAYVCQVWTKFSEKFRNVNTIEVMARVDTILDSAHQ
jgi:hypothetical protein